jgi:hypothetical protein
VPGSWGWRPSLRLRWPSALRPSSATAYGPAAGPSPRGPIVPGSWGWRPRLRLRWPSALRPPRSTAYGPAAGPSPRGPIVPGSWGWRHRLRLRRAFGPLSVECDSLRARRRTVAARTHRAWVLGLAPQAETALAFGPPSVECDSLRARRRTAAARTHRAWVLGLAPQAETALAFGPPSVECDSLRARRRTAAARTWQLRELRWTEGRRPDAMTAWGASPRNYDIQDQGPTARSIVQSHT